MTIEQKPFVQYNDRDEVDKVDTFTVRLNKEERERLNYIKKVLRQPKDSTAVKQMFELGYNVLHEEKIVKILDTVFKNRKNNAKLGIVDYD